MRDTFLAMLALSALLAGCGGGGSTGANYSVPAATTPAPTTAPTSTPTNTPTNAPTTAPTTAPASVLSTTTINGSAGYVTPSGMTTYVFDADLAFTSGSSCGGACATNWPPLAPPAGATIAAPWSQFTRSDGKVQLAYNGRPLYTFIGDGAPGQATGDGVNAFGGLWHVARPTSSTPTTAPSTPPNPGPYSVHRK